MSVRDRLEMWIDTAIKSTAVNPHQSARRAQLRAVLGIVVLILVVGFFIAKAKTTTEDLIVYWQPLSFLNITVSLLLVGATFILMAGLWWMLIRLLGGQVKVGEALQAYFLSSLPRYIPGSVWGYVGRTYLIEQRGVRRAVAVFSTLIEIALLVGSSLGVGGVFLLKFPNAALVALLIGLVMIIGLTFVTLIFNPDRGFQLQFLGISTLIIIAYFVFWVIYGLSIVILIESFVSRITVVDALNVTSGFAIAWLAGFLAIFVPGGLGIREAGIVLILEPMTNSVMAIFLAILSRLINLFVDALLFGVALLTRRRLPKGKSENHRLEP